MSDSTVLRIVMLLLCFLVPWVVMSFVVLIQIRERL